jgi:hypothetical protein
MGSQVSEGRRWAAGLVAVVLCVVPAALLGFAFFIGGDPPDPTPAIRFIAVCAVIAGIVGWTIAPRFKASLAVAAALGAVIPIMGVGAVFGYLKLVEVVDARKKQGYAAEASERLYLEGFPEVQNTKVLGNWEPGMNSATYHADSEADVQQAFSGWESIDSKEKVWFAKPDKDRILFASFDRKGNYLYYSVTSHRAMAEQTADAFANYLRNQKLECAKLLATKNGKQRLEQPEVASYFSKRRVVQGVTSSSRDVLLIDDQRAAFRYALDGYEFWILLTPKLPFWQVEDVSVLTGHFTWVEPDGTQVTEEWDATGNRKTTRTK